MKLHHVTRSPVELYHPAECKPLVADQQIQSERNKCNTIITTTSTKMRETVARFDADLMHKMLA